MMTPRTFAPVVAALGATWLASACGSYVTVEVVGGGGADASAASTSDASSGETASGSGGTSVVTVGSVTVATSTSVTSGPTGPQNDVCVEACKAAAVAGFPKSVDTCIADCHAVTPVCMDAHQSWLACVVNGGFAYNYVSGACAPLLLNYVLCKGGCLGGACSGGSAGDCQCAADCGGSKYTTQCFPTQPGDMVCSCQADGVFMGKCSGNGDAKNCDAMRSCCGALFFVDG